MTAADRARAECEAQGVPFTITDRSVLHRIATLIRSAPALGSSAASPPAVVGSNGVAESFRGSGDPATPIAEPRCPACLRGQHDLCAEQLGDGASCQCTTCDKDSDPLREQRAAEDCGRLTTAKGA